GVLQGEVDVPARDALPLHDLPLHDDVREGVAERDVDRPDRFADGPDARLAAPGLEAERERARRHRAVSPPASRSAASARFERSMATVSGPTPPGTGVMADATARTDSKSTSPSSFGAPGAGFSTG